MLIEEIQRADLPLMARMWRSCYPCSQVTDVLFPERVMTGEQVLRRIAREENSGEIAGWVVVERLEGTLAGIRAMALKGGMVPSPAGEELLALAETWATAQGSDVLTWGATPPFYLMPGVPTTAIAWLKFLETHGWCKHADHFNMTVELGSLELSPGDEACIVDGVSIKRASHAERGEILYYLENKWRASVVPEVDLAFNHDPISLFIAREQGEIIGYAAYDVNQAAGSFGPTGVDEDKRGKGIGRLLLRACLYAAHAQGLSQCQIGWVGPAEFYVKNCNGQPGPAFVEMRKTLNKSRRGVSPWARIPDWS